MSGFLRVAHAPPWPGEHARLACYARVRGPAAIPICLWWEPAHERAPQEGACALLPSGACTAGMLRTGQGACGPPPPVAPFRRSFPRRPPAYVLNRPLQGRTPIRWSRSAIALNVCQTSTRWLGNRVQRSRLRRSRTVCWRWVFSDLRSQKVKTRFYQRYVLPEGLGCQPRRGAVQHVRRGSPRKGATAGSDWRRGPQAP
jgi:hypothetical protein